MKRKFKFRNKLPEQGYMINEEIQAHKVRIIGDNVESGIYDIEKALEMAEAEGLDLIEIASHADPPVCKILDFSKFRYKLKKKQEALKSKAYKTVVKEIRFGPNTDTHDLNFKIKHAINFLKEGNKVKAYVNFYGRAIVYKNRGKDLLLNFSKAVEEYGKIEQKIRLEGRRMIIIIVPKSRK